jgi:hypothetical protein
MLVAAEVKVMVGILLGQGLVVLVVAEVVLALLALLAWAVEEAVVTQVVQTVLLVVQALSLSLMQVLLKDQQVVL